MTKNTKQSTCPPTALAEQQALNWMAKLTRGSLSQQQSAEFAIWLSLDPTHQPAFDGLLDIWELTADLSPLAQDRAR